MRESASVHDSRAPGEHGPLDPAEACTELGADDFDDAAQFVTWQAVFAIVIVGAIAGAAALL